MDFNHLSGSFGSDFPRMHNNDFSEDKPKKNNQFKYKIKCLSIENWVDIICCTIIAAALTAVFCNWEAVMNRLFMSFLFPIIKILAKAIAIVAGILCVGGVITAGAHRRRHWYY